MNSLGRNSADTGSELRFIVDRLVRLEEDKAEIAAGIKEVKQEAASKGFDKKVVAQMVREARMSELERAAQREHEAMCEVYRASLGMLRGTPLGDAARKRFEPQPEPDGDSAEAAPAPAEPEAIVIPPEEIEAARERGREDARAGEKVTANPFIAGDPRRAAWDEGWCAETGSDGMDIPAAWRRKPKPKKPDDRKPDGED